MKVVPLPGSERISIEPLSFWMLVFTTSMPTPRPETSEATSLVEKPGRKTRFRLCRSSMRIGLFIGDDALLQRLGAQALGTHAPAVVGDDQDDVVAFLARLEADLRLFRLAGGQALLGRLDAVIDGIADQVDERIGQSSIIVLSISVSSPTSTSSTSLPSCAPDRGQCADISGTAGRSAACGSSSPRSAGPTPAGRAG